MENETVINLGCGPDYKEGAVNVDRKDWLKVDKVHDLNTYPYPFKDNTADKIYLLDVLEHLLEPEKAVAEAFRILKPNGILMVRVPYIKSSVAWHSLEHRHRGGFTWHTFDEYDASTKIGKKLADAGYHKERFRIVERHWLRGRYAFWDRRAITWTLQAIK